MNVMVDFSLLSAQLCGAIEKNESGVEFLVMPQQSDRFDDRPMDSIVDGINELFMKRDLYCRCCFFRFLRVIPADFSGRNRSMLSSFIREIIRKYTDWTAGSPQGIWDRIYTDADNYNSGHDANTFTANDAGSGFFYIHGRSNLRSACGGYTGRIVRGEKCRASGFTS